jgi:protein FrlC
MVDHPRFKIMIDTCAMGVAGETLQQWFDMFGSENIIHTHFIDGNPYGHLVWGNGKHHLGEFLKTMYDNGYKGLFSQELTDQSYYTNPFFYDQRNMANLNQYFF